MLASIFCKKKRSKLVKCTSRLVIRWQKENTLNERSKRIETPTFNQEWQGTALAFLVIFLFSVSLTLDRQHPCLYHDQVNIINIIIIMIVKALSKQYMFQIILIFFCCFVAKSVLSFCVKFWVENGACVKKWQIWQIWLSLLLMLPLGLPTNPS